MRIPYRLPAMVAAVTALIMVPSTANATNSVPEPQPTTVKLVVTGASFGLAKGESRTISVTGTRVPNSGTANDVGTAAACHLGGSFPYVIEPSGLERRINFTADLRCDGVTGQVELTVGLQQRLPGGGYTNDKFNGPLANATPLIILGVNSDPKPCFEISLGAWRGVAHPRLITDAVIYDFGWWPTYDVSLTC